MRCIGPFLQVITLENAALKGPINDNDLHIVKNAGILVHKGKIVEVGQFDEVRKKATEIEEMSSYSIAVPGFIDSHTHICFDGKRSIDFSMRNQGKSYIDISKEGGGIWSTVRMTRASSEQRLVALMENRINKLIENGITTVEVKSGYGLDTQSELKMLRAIDKIKKSSPIDVISTCLAAHTLPKDRKIDHSDYLQEILYDLEPIIRKEKLTRRFDIFVEEEAFSPTEAKKYLKVLKKCGYELTIHADQFSSGGSALGIEMNASSVDHLEESTDMDIDVLARTNVVCNVLPGASIGLGIKFAPIRRMIDQGCIVGMASDWNPGSAPNGDLLLQASILASYEKLSNAEVLRSLTKNAALALGLKWQGQLTNNYAADFIAFHTDDFRDILYYQGNMRPCCSWKGGNRIL